MEGDDTAPRWMISDNIRFRGSLWLPNIPANGLSPVARYRIIYRPDAHGVTVVYIGPRGDVYDTLRELLSEGKTVR